MVGFRAYIYDGIVVFDIAQDLKAAQLPLSAFRCVYRPNPQVAVNRRSFIIDKFDSPLRTY